MSNSISVLCEAMTQKNKSCSNVRSVDCKYCSTHLNYEEKQKTKKRETTRMINKRKADDLELCIERYKRINTENQKNLDRIAAARAIVDEFALEIPNTPPALPSSRPPPTSNMRRTNVDIVTTPMNTGK